MKNSIKYTDWQENSGYIDLFSKCKRAVKDIETDTIITTDESDNNNERI